MNAIEIDDIHYELLANNIACYDIKDRITTYHCDCVDLICKKSRSSIYKRQKYIDDDIKEPTPLKQDIIFLSPPWGGPRYKENKNPLRLKLSEISLTDIIKDIIVNKTAKIIACMLPSNFDFNNLQQNIRKHIQKSAEDNPLQSAYHIHMIGTYQLLVIPCL